MERHPPLLLSSGIFGWSTISPLPTVFQQQQQPHPQQQQIRTFVRRRKRREEEKKRQRKLLRRRRGYPVYFQSHNEKKYAPMNFRTHIGRVMNKATRGERKMEYLIDFVEEYMKYNGELRRTVILPYLRENFQKSAFEGFFLRILQSITFDNNKTGLNGFNFVIQLRTDLMGVIYDKAAELKTLDSKVKLMTLRLLQYDKMKRVIRKQMSQYIHDEISSKPFPIFIPDSRKELFPSKSETSKSSQKAACNDKQNDQRSNKTNSTVGSSDAGPNDVSGTITSVLSHISENVPTTEPSDEQSPIRLGCVRRLHYNDLTVRFLQKCERRDPKFKSKLLGHNKIVYGWYQTEESMEPDAMMFVSLQDRIPSSLSEILSEEKDAETQKELKVATFYGISVLNPALQKIGLGECMIRPIIQYLLDDPEIPLSINQFSTLLPLYSFHNWLLSNDFEDDISLLVINDASEDFNTLMREWECPPQQVFRRLKALLSRNYKTFQATTVDKPIISTAVNNLLLLSASSYLIRAKTPVVKWRCNPLEISTRYHVAQGASIHRINLAADPSDSGWEESFGLMTNHIYDVQNLESNQAKYNKKFNSIEIHDAVRKHIPKPRKLQLNKEQRERWLPIDPVRKKMLELSKNGKLFRVPLFGPPALSRKRSFHKRLVPERVRPGLLPPVVPTVGVSGLTVYVKPVTAASLAIPSYVSRTMKGNETKVSPKSIVGKSNGSSTSYWPDEVDLSFPLTPIPQEMKKNKSASQRGNRKKERASWDS